VGPEEVSRPFSYHGIQHDMTTVELHWRECLPTFPVPARGYVRNWLLNAGSVEVVMQVVGEIADAIKENVIDCVTPETPGRLISTTLRRYFEERQLGLSLPRV
jgi:hypothetical protein